MAEAVQGPAPSGPQLLALLAAPEHCFARMARDLFDTSSVAAATLEVRPPVLGERIAARVECICSAWQAHCHSASVPLDNKENMNMLEPAQYRCYPR